MLVRLSPLVAPMMHTVDIRIHHFFVPHRLVWQDFEKFITGGADGEQNPILPKKTTPAGVMEGSIFDAYGIPPTAAGIAVNALPLRGYNLIFNKYFRDQDLTTELDVPKTSGTDTTTYQLQRIAWKKDYFTTARPWAQKGPAVTLPMGEGSAPVKGIGKLNQTYTGASNNVYETGGSGTTNYPANDNSFVGTASNDISFYIREDANNAGYPGIFAEMDGVEGPLVNEVRLAFALQRFQEARAQYGSEYVDYLRYLGIRPSDARLQRPEYLGGGKATVQISEVLETAQTVDTSDEPLGITGGLKGHGISSLRSGRWRRFFEEHGYIHSFVSLRPRTAYLNGLERHWGYETREEFFQKELERIGQQEIWRQEIYADAATPKGMWAYQDRYDHLRQAQGVVSGEFRTTLNYWHMARVFDSIPTLNDAFVKCDPTDRVFAVPSEDLVYIYGENKIQARRMVGPGGRQNIIL